MEPTEPAKPKPEPAKVPPPLLKGEISAKTTFQRSAKGPIQVSECSADGKFVVVENTGKRVFIIRIIINIIIIVIIGRAYTTLASLRRNLICFKTA